MKVLLVEDEHKIANAIKSGLNQEKFIVDVEHDSDNGYGAAVGHSYDVLVIDRMLPGTMEGVELCQKLRQAGVNTPILMLTAKGQIRDKVEGLNSGADDYLVKPFSFDELVARLRALSRRPTQAKSNLLEVGDLSLDTINFKVTRQDKVIHLSAKEFALLEYFMRNPGRILSKDSIIGQVWEFDAEILPNTVEVYIGYLRNKLEKPFRGTPLIKTIRGFGYQLEASE